ncbi:uncharacterized protein LOC133528309 [Cydia pomonella]|uniref:uncharacterized protein LOC133528309 n=1 Tax=Cydia pomonella TaxID=82600 RepID=UPI002ADE120C|nr:uncharacterized protein LOC133528309 [Cydia pomonella]XP_061721645.1 uncharacterized protein LOC133528309 [Cydia pomonella]
MPMSAIMFFRAIRYDLCLKEIKISSELIIKMNRRKLKKLLDILDDDSDEAPRKGRKNTIISSSDEEEEPPKKKRRRILPIEESDDEQADEEKENILLLIGEPDMKKNVISINPKLAELWQNIIQKGLNKEGKKKLEEKIPSIENCFVQAPKLNEEIEITLNKSAKTRDEKLCEKQNQIGLVIANLNKILKDLINKNEKDYVEPLGDSIRLLADLHFLETETRKAVILPGLNKTLKDTLEKTQTTTFLFGNDLHKIIKKSKDLEKSIKDMQQNKTLNYWSPSSTNNQMQGGPRKNYLSKIRTYQRNYYRTTAAATAVGHPPRRTQRQWSPRRQTRGRRHHLHRNKK